MSVLSLAAGVALAAASAGPVPAIRAPVTDQADVLTDSEERHLDTTIRELRADHGVQMAVLTVNTTAGQPIEDYAHRIAEAWGGGREGKDDGVLFVLAIQDRRLRLEVGYGLEEWIVDAEARRILDDVGPLMRDGRTAAAVLQVVQGVEEETSLLSPAGTPTLAGRVLEPVREVYRTGPLQPGPGAAMILTLAAWLTGLLAASSLMSGVRLVRSREGGASMVLTGLLAIGGLALLGLSVLVVGLDSFGAVLLVVPAGVVTRLVFRATREPVWAWFVLVFFGLMGVAMLAAWVIELDHGHAVTAAAGLWAGALGHALLTWAGPPRGGGSTYSSTGHRSSSVSRMRSRPSSSSSSSRSSSGGSSGGWSGGGGGFGGGGASASW